MRKFREIDPAILTYFRYEPDTGNFYRLPRPNAHKNKVGLLTAKKRGYINIRWNKIDYSAARVAMKFMGIDVPNDMMVDHINGNRADNRFCNLRIVSKQNNEVNRKEHKNKFLVIKDDEIYDSFASYEDALIYGLKKIGNVPFLIQQVMEEEPIHFFTHDVGFQCHA